MSRPLIHFNGTNLDDIPGWVKALQGFDKPIVCNEDAKTGAAGAKAAELSVARGRIVGVDARGGESALPVPLQGSGG